MNKRDDGESLCFTKLITGNKSIKCNNISDDFVDIAKIMGFNSKLIEEKKEIINHKLEFNEMNGLYVKKTLKKDEHYPVISTKYQFEKRDIL